MTRLILVRHGETETNIKGNLHKYSDNEVLTPNGINQIEKAAEYIKKEKPSKIFCSQEKRAVQSAEIISKKLNIPVIKISGLEERNWGDYAGLPFSEIKQKAGMDNMTFSERYNFVPPNGESWKVTEERLLKVLDKIIVENKDRTVVLVTHSGPIKIYIPTLLGVNKEESYKYDPDNASISIFDYEDGRFSKIFYNDTSHLK